MHHTCRRPADANVYFIASEAKRAGAQNKRDRFGAALSALTVTARSAVILRAARERGVSKDGRAHSGEHIACGHPSRLAQEGERLSRQRQSRCAGMTAVF